MSLIENEDGDTKLFLAIIYGQSREALELIDGLLGDDYEEQLSHANNLGQTALHLAVMTGDADITRRLVIAGSPLHLQERGSGDTALHAACRRCRRDLVDAIIEPVRYRETKLNNNYDIPYRRPPFDVRNFHGETCLILACGITTASNADAADRQRVSIIRSLIVGGSDIEDCDGKTGRNCLHLIANRRDGRALVEAVLPNVSIGKVKKAIHKPDWSGYTPFGIIREIDVLHSIQRLAI